MFLHIKHSLGVGYWKILRGLYTSLKEDGCQYHKKGGCAWVNIADPHKVTPLHGYIQGSRTALSWGSPPQLTGIQIYISSGLKGSCDTDTMTAVLKAETYTSSNNIERGNGSNALEIFKDIIITLKRQILRSRLSKTMSPLWHTVQ